MITEAPPEIEMRPPRADDREVVISVRDVGKMYRIYERPQDRLKQMLFWRLGKSYGREFWALRDASFEVRRGETVGIIGRNGSGKSTLLQIIAGTLAPTVGEVQIKGRVAALLELGSGFNPEFTGRENVFLNGAILGISRAEMEAYFDQIAAFADIGEFIDQPVKTYSSGMVVRLAFAVQVYVPKDILIVDEALSVGDMFFQAKCLAVMRRLLDDGVTVLFVSHDTGAVKSLCRRGLLLQNGTILADGHAGSVIERYFALRVRHEQATALPPTEVATAAPAVSSRVAIDPEFERRAAFQRIQNGKASFTNVQLLNEHGVPITDVDYDQIVTLRMWIKIFTDIESDLGFGYHIRSPNGVDVVYTDSVIEQAVISKPRAGEEYIVDWTFCASLQHGHYNIACVLSIPILLSASQVEFCDFIPLAVQFSMAPRVDSPLYGIVHLPNQVSVRKVGFEVMP